MANDERDFAGAGWRSSFPEFTSADPSVERDALRQFTGDSSEAQLRAWRDSIPPLQREASAVCEQEEDGCRYSALMEYRLPLEQRRTDVIFLVGAPVLVLELKGKAVPSQADLDQAHAYARDLRAYHRECHSRPVHPVLVPMRGSGHAEYRDGVWICPPSELHELVCQLMDEHRGPALDRDAFLSSEAYRPLPTIVAAARELFFSREIRDVWRARAATTPAVDYIANVAHEAARTRTRHLILVTGVPGAGKTLVGMRAVHAHFLDDLAIPRADGKPSAPALFLSGNGPLVEVLQYALKKAGGGGRTFVRHIKDYLDAYVPNTKRVPPEHLLVFDEAQRAFTPDRVEGLHKRWSKDLIKGEPHLFVECCSRMPEWSVLVGLIGTGQEIHLGEEGGLGQWRDALLSNPQASTWTLHAPAELESVLAHPRIRSRWARALCLDTELRFHGAQRLHQLVEWLLESGIEAVPQPHSIDGIRLYITRDLDRGKTYLRERYADQPEARFGLLASSRDRDLPAYGIDNSWSTTNRISRGPWYVNGDEDPASCRHLTSCMTEFGAQGLELDMPLVGWGTDLMRIDGRWDNSNARKYRAGEVALVDPMKLRLNAYRVLLTRGRDGTIVYVPPDDRLNETYNYLCHVGFRPLP